MCPLRLKRYDFMENVIIVIILLVIILFSINQAIKHSKGQSGCCGSGELKLKKKKLKNVLYSKTYLVKGMKCNACKTRVEETINDIKNLSGQVNLKKCELVVSFGEKIDDEIIFKKIRRLGYDISKLN